MPDNQFDDIQEWASGVPHGEGELVLSKAEIEEIVDNAFSTLGTLTDDPGDIPGSATARPRGSFTLPDDMRLYLEGGGLITYDAGGNIVASPIVYILKYPSESDGLIIYEVWINEES